MRWNLKPNPDVNQLKSLSDALNVSELIAQLLLQRGVTDFESARRFFRPTLSDLHDPFLMKDMEAAVHRIEQAIAKAEKILVFGDYDVDGTTSVALVSSYLSSYCENVATYIPDRYKEGYGVSYAGIDFAHDNGIGLIIALDCGIKSIDHVNYAREKGIDFIICDHHRPGPELPKAVAVLDPKREDCYYPYDELCGCGVGFKLIQALHERRGFSVESLSSYLDLAAIAIAADIVPITGENRVLATFGLKQLNRRERPGIKALVAQLKKSTLDIGDVVFVIAPRINAAGRIRHGHHAVALLTESDEKTAQEMAAEIESYNKSRRELDQRITCEALEQIERKSEQDRRSTVVFDPSWHKGVIGIVASRLIETHYRPTLVFTKTDERLAASARSVYGFDLYNALEACREHIEQFGGHMYAAGLTLKPENYEAFKAAFEEVVTQTLPESLREPQISIDAEISLEQLDDKTMRILKQFAPFGPQNMAPVFIVRNATDTGFARPIGKDSAHLKAELMQNGARFSAIGFGLGKKIDFIAAKKPVDAVFCIEENHYRGEVSIQLRLKDVAASASEPSALNTRNENPVSSNTPYV